MLTSLVSTLTGRAVKCDIAMTGELTLTGRVLPIGGLREKTAAAAAAGIKRVIIPKENKRDLAEIDAAVRSALAFFPCSRAEEVLALALNPAQRRDAVCTKEADPAILHIPESAKYNPAGAYCK